MAEQLEEIKLSLHEMKIIKIGKYEIPILISNDIPEDEIWIFDGKKIHKIINIGKV